MRTSVPDSHRPAATIARFVACAVFALGIAAAGTAHAQACSGGPDGGMDATGNQCNDAALVAPQAPAEARTAGAQASPAARRDSVAYAYAARGAGRHAPARADHDGKRTAATRVSSR
ncbi:MAG: hypothetical protein U1F58_00015 [Burkholderiales bacterium]